jgi:hypothetical protein
MQTRWFHTRQLLKSYVASTTKQNGLSSIQNILCLNILRPFARTSYQSLHKSYIDIEISFIKLHHQQHSFFSFVVNGKHIVDGKGTNPWD